MRPLFCLILLLSLVACKSTSLTPINSGSDPKWTGAEKYEVLVAMLAYTPETRILFETRLADALKKEGISAVPSYTVYPNLSSLNGDTFSKFLAADPSLAVLFTQAKNVNKEQSNKNKDGSNFLSDLLMSGGEWDTTFTALMESALYVHGQTDAVWWSRVRLEAKEKKVQEVVRDYVRDEIKLMKQGGAISRLK